MVNRALGMKDAATRTRAAGHRHVERGRLELKDRLVMLTLLGLRHVSNVVMVP